jgi:hypothetical protein
MCRNREPNASADDGIMEGTIVSFVVGMAAASSVTVGLLFLVGYLLKYYRGGECG